MLNTKSMNEGLRQPTRLSGTGTNPRKPIFSDYNSQYRSLETFKASDASQKSIPLRIFDHSNPLRPSSFEENSLKLQNEKRIMNQTYENNTRSHRGPMIDPPESYFNSDDAEIAEFNTINRIPVSPIGLKQMNSPLLNLQNEHREPYPSFISAESSMTTSMPNLLPARKTQTRIFDKKEPNQPFERNFKPLLSNLSFHAPKFPTASLSNLEQKDLLSTPAKLKIQNTESKSEALSTQVTNPKRLRHSNLSTLTESDTNSSKKNNQFASKFSLKYKDHRSSPEVDGRSTFYTNNNEHSNKKLDFPDPDDELYRLKKPMRTETLEFEKVNLESRFSLTSEKFKDYFQEPKNWIKSLLTPNPRKGLKCDCDIGLAIDKTCSRALRWLLKKYKSSELPYLKETYEKIVLEEKIIEFEQTRQIDKDINRTFPKSQLFQHGSDGVQILKRVLNAIAKYDPSVGYVQGMNFIAGSLLFHAEEYIAFWVLVSLFEELEMRDIFLPKLPGLSKHCQITEILLFNYKPNIYSKLCEFQIRPELFLTEWVLTLFGNIAPINDMGEIYENLFMQRWVFFYKLVLAFMTHFEKEIEQESDMIGVLTILKSQNRLANKPDNFKSPHKVDWRDLSKKANEIFIDPAFIDEMHLKFDIQNQWFRTTS